MPRPVRPWYRFYTETPRDPKIRRLTVSQRWIWTCVIAAARDSQVPGHLFVAENLPMTHEELADYAGVKLKEIAPALDEMTRMGMVHIGDDGVLIVTNFQRRQYESDTSTDRTRKHRERSKDEGSDDVGTFQPRSENARRNAPETETETETEKPFDARKRAHRLPEDWRPTEADITWQRSEGITDLQAKRETDKFRDHWKAAAGQASRKLDWSAAWKNWLRRARDEGRFGRPAADPSRPAKPAWEA